MPAVLRPARRRAAVDRVADRPVGAGGEQRADRVEVAVPAARWSAVMPSPWPGPPNVDRRFGSAPSASSASIARVRPPAAAQASAVPR